MNSVEGILYYGGACLSSDLTKKLIETYNISDVAARKRVSRGCPKLRKLPYINFPKNSKFLYLESDFGSPEYWVALEKALVKSQSCYSMAYNAIKYRGGVLPEAYFDSVCGSPLKQKKHIPAKTVMDNLLKSNILFRRNINGIGKCLVIGELNRDKSSERLDEISKETVSRLIVENTVAIPLISRWLINIGFTSKSSVRDRSVGAFPKVLNFEWDITASSYLNILSSFSADDIKPGFVACDIFIEEDVDSRVIETYIKKTKNCSGASKSTNVLYIFVSKSFSYEALMMARRSSGVLAITLDDMLGRRLSEGVFNLIETLEDVLSSSINRKSFKRILKAFEGVQGIYGNVRGLLFEFLCCDILRSPYAYTIERSKKIRTNQGDSEIDIYAHMNKERRYIECKGWKKTSTLDESEVEKWLNKRIPNTLKSIKEEGLDFTKTKVTMELWATCKISDKSIEMIEKRNNDSKKFDIVVKNINDIYEMAKKNGDEELIKTYETIFLDKKGKFAITPPSVDLGELGAGNQIPLDDIPF